MRSLIDKDFLVIKEERMPQITFENDYSETKCSIDLEKLRHNSPFKEEKFFIMITS